MTKSLNPTVKPVSANCCNSESAIVKEITDEIKKLNLQLKTVRTQQDKDVERLSRYLTQLARLIK
jgi:chaperonin cofactor prefoldin